MAFVGLGAFAAQLAAAAHRAGNIQIVRCFTRTPDKRQQFCRQFGGQEAESLEQVCEDPRVQGVVLATPNDLHCEQTLALAAAGKHVFVEKPLCNTTDEAARMIAACDRAGVILAVGHQERRNSAYRRLHQMILDGHLGTVHSFQASQCGDLLGKYGVDDWRFDVGHGVGPIHHKGIHKIDLLNYLFGTVEAAVTMAQPLPGRPQMQQTAVTCLRFASGLVGTIHSGFCHNSHDLCVFGQTMQVGYDGHGDALHTRSSEWQFKQIQILPVDALREEMHEFAQATLGCGTVEVDGRAGAEAVAAADAALRACQTHSEVRLDELRVPGWVPASSTAMA